MTGSRLRSGAVSIVGLGLITILAGSSCHSNPGSGGQDGGSGGGGGPGGGGGWGGGGGAGGGGGGGGVGGNTAGAQSVLQRGNDIYRRATYVQPGLTVAAVAAMAPDTMFNTNATFPANGSLPTNQGTASVLYI